MATTCRHFEALMAITHPEAHIHDDNESSRRGSGEADEEFPFES